jgi:hypothetical protein
MTEPTRPRSGFVRNLRRALKHPFVSIFVGVVMVGSGLAEVLREADPTFESLLRVHHGVILIGLVTGLKGLVEALEGLETVGEAYEPAE